MSTDAIRELRERTGAGIMDCKRAIQDADGDLDKAEVLLREKGIARAGAKSGRATGEGLVEAYIHAGGRVGAIVEINCETDFVSRTPEFRDMAHDIAMQVAAMSPVYVSADDQPAEDSRSPEEVCLLSQPFIKDPSRVVNDLILDIVARVGENVQVRRFARYGLGE